ncbi:MAG: cold shock domain-containing protein [Bacteroidetes bacterium]|nr:MAG: cold shock domain-containing protein [Bacteroidota bacterium]
MSTKNTGTVKFYNEAKGYGFIKHDNSSNETFVHATGLIDKVRQDDLVEFDLQDGKKGMNAVNVRVIS